MFHQEYHVQSSLTYYFLLVKKRNDYLKYSQSNNSQISKHNLYEFQDFSISLKLSFSNFVLFSTPDPWE